MDRITSMVQAMHMSKDDVDWLVGYLHDAAWTAECGYVCDEYVERERKATEALYRLAEMLGATGDSLAA